MKVVIGECQRAVRSDVGHGNHLHNRLGIERADHLVAVQEPWARQVLHEEDGTDDGVRRKAEPAFLQVVDQHRHVGAAAQ